MYRITPDISVVPEICLRADRLICLFIEHVIFLALKFQDGGLVYCESVFVLTVYFTELVVYVVRHVSVPLFINYIRAAWQVECR